MSSLKTITSATTVRQEFEIYLQCDAHHVCSDPRFNKDTSYYQTYGGGGEGGFFVKTRYDKDVQRYVVEAVYSVKREWGTPFFVRKVSWTDAWFTPAEEANNNIDTLVLEKPKKSYKPRAKKGGILNTALVQRVIVKDGELVNPEDTSNWIPVPKKVQNPCEECGQGENNNMKCSGKEDQDVSFVCDSCINKDKPEDLYDCQNCGKENIKDSDTHNVDDLTVCIDCFDKLSVEETNTIKQDKTAPHAFSSAYCTLLD